MSQPAERTMSLSEFFAWQERQPDRYELVGGHPVRMMVGVTNTHDRIVVNLLLLIGSALRGSGCSPFTGESGMETYPGQIRRPDLGVDCGKPDPDGYVADKPRLVAEVMSPSTRDFDVISKLPEYQAVETLDTILYVETNWAEVTIWRRAPARGWTREYVLDDGAVEVPGLDSRLPLADIYEGVSFPSGPRLIPGGLNHEAG